MYNLKELQESTLKWSYQRGILTNGKATTQALKLVSEVGELCRHHIEAQDIKDDIGDCLVVLTNLSSLTKCAFNVEIAMNNKPSLAGDIWYMMVKLNAIMGNLCDNVAKNLPITDEMYYSLYLLANIADLNGTTIEECWNLAYNDIKDRKGFLNSNGNFIKSTDANYEQLLMEFEEGKD